jgi:hypothetical protein
MNRPQRNRYVLHWSEPSTTSRRQPPMGHEVYGPERLSDLLVRVEALLGWGYGVSITPPAEPPTIEVSASFR